MADEQRIDGELVVGMNSQPLEEGMKKAADATDKQTQRMNKAVANYEKALAALQKVQQQIGQAGGMQNLAKNTESALQKAEASVKRYEKQIEKLKQQAATYEQQQAAQLEKTLASTKARTQSQLEILNRRDQSTVKRETERRITSGVIGSQVASNIRLRRDMQGELDEERRKHDLLLTFTRDRLQRERALERDISQERKRLRREEIAEAKRVAREQERLVQQFFKQRGGVSAVLFGDINQAAARSNLSAQMAAGAAGGVSPSQTWQQMMNQAIARSNAAGAASFAAQAAAAGGGRGAGGGGRSGGGLLGRFLGAGGGGIPGSIVSGLASGFGIGLGGYAVAQAGRAVVEATETATAYNRQQVAAENLAGSQSKLLALLNAYNEASGGAIDKTTELANVTRLLATGFADSVEDVERFVRATRGASIALGRPQDYVIQETQLAISNTSQKRLDQIGLSIEEVTTRIEQLRRANADWSRETAFQEAVLSIMDEKYGKLTETLEGQATGVEKLRKSWADAQLEMGQASDEVVNELSNALSWLIDNEVERLVQKFTDIRDLSVQIANLLGMNSGFVLTSRQQRWVDNNRGRDMARHRRTGESDVDRFNPDQWDVITGAFDALEQVQVDANRAMLEEEKRYGEQRASLVRNFGKQMAREEEDFQRQRARSLRDYERSILTIMRDAQERERDMQEDLDERLVELREDSNERVQEIEEKYRKDREKAEKQHRDRLLKAAGQLDAIAVLEERKRWREENKEAQEGHKEALEKQREALDEQIEEALKAHNKRLEAARKADAKRLEDMRVARAQQLADENEDRAIRKRRAIEDHNEQLEELDRQHSERMDQIARQAAEETKVLEDALAKDLTAVGIYVEGYLEKIKARDQVIEEWFDKIILRLEDVIRQENVDRQRSIYNPNSAVGPRLSSGAMMHDGSATTAAAPAVASVTYGGTRNFTIEAGAFTVQTLPGMEFDVGQSIEETVIRLLENY